MKVADYLPESLQSLGRFFWDELTEDRPGRVAQATQLGALSLLTVFLFMTFRIPFCAVGLIALFYGVQSNSFFSKVVGIVFIVATVLDVGLLFLVLKFFYGYPLVRIIASGLILLFSMYMMRVCKLGIMFFAVALVVIYGQTTPDGLDFPELAVRAILWCVLVALYVVVLLVFGCGFLFPSRPLQQMQRALGRQLAEVSVYLQRLAGEVDAAMPEVKISRLRIEKDALMLQALHAFVCGDDKDYRAHGAYWKSCLATVAYLRMRLNRLSVELPAFSDAGRALLHSLQTEVSALAAAIEQAQPYRSEWMLDDAQRAVASEYGLNGVCRTLQDLGRFDLALPEPKADKGSLFVADALTNPNYLRYALKVVLASLVCYTLYNGLDWDGIHTSLLTSVIIANPSAGATNQKIMLRVGGAAIGALLAFFTTIFIVPRLDSIAGLLLMLTPIFFIGGWVASGSERSGYIGTQFVFTFALATLENTFGPLYDLVEVRDRALGILIGIAISSVIYTVIWPESEAGLIRKKVADTLRQLGKLVRSSDTAGGSEQLGYLQQRVACWDDFRTSSEMNERVAVEYALPGVEQQQILQRFRQTLAGSRQILDSWDAVHSAGGAAEPALQVWRGQVADALDHYADSLGAGPATAGAPGTLPMIPPAGLSPALALPAQQLTQQIMDLPDWTASAPLAAANAVPTGKAS